MDNKQKNVIIKNVLDKYRTQMDSNGNPVSQKELIDKINNPELIRWVEEKIVIKMLHDIIDDFYGK